MTTVQVDQSAPSRPILTTIGLLALVVAGVIGADPYRVRERVVDAVAPTAEVSAPSQAGWTGVVSLRGIGATTASPFAIDRTAVQWRVKWSCQFVGHMTVQPSGQPGPVIDALCPGSGAGFASRTGSQVLDVRAEGPWMLDVEQQLGGGRRVSSA